MTEMLDVVDENDKVIRVAPREEVRANNLRYRASKIYIRNKVGQYYVQKRSMEKDMWPGMWAAGVGETLQSKENYEQAAIRGVEEELGLTVEVRFLFSMSIELENDREKTHIFLAVTDQEPIPNPEEVSEGKWVSEEELKTMWTENYSPSARRSDDQYFAKEMNKEDFLEDVDDNDNVKSIRFWKDVFDDGTFRSANVFVFNDKGELFIHQRSKNLPSPLKWDVKVGGCLRIGETYEEGAKREAQEEIGVDVDVEYLFKMQYRKEHNSNRHVFKAHHNGPFSLQEYEIAQGKFASLDEVKRMIQNGDMSDSAAAVFTEFEKHATT